MIRKVNSNYLYSFSKYRFDMNYLNNTENTNDSIYITYSNELISILLPDNMSQYKLNIYNQQGQNLITTELNSSTTNQIPLNLSTGVYFAVLYYNDRVLVKKFLVQ